MSQNDAALVLDNRINVSHSYTKLVRISGTQVNQYEYNPQGASFTNTLNFQNIVTPSLSNTLVSKCMRVRYLLAIAAAATPGFYNPRAPLANAGTSGAGNGATMALRAHPLMSVCDTISLLINNQTTTIPSRMVLSAMQRRLPWDWKCKQATEFPVMSDNSTYLAVDIPGGSTTNGIATSNQPLSGYYNSLGYTRASFYPVSYNNTPATTGAAANTVVFEVSEPVLISPLTIYQNETFLGNINTLSILFNYSQLSDIYVMGAGAALPGGIAAPVIYTPYLELGFIQVSNQLVSIPRVVSYPYERIVYFQDATTQTMANANASQTWTVNSSTLRLDSMPALIYIMFRPQVNTRTPQFADAMLALGDGANGGSGKPGLQINIGNRTGLLANASNKTLYEMSVRNGYQGTYTDWQYGSGSLLIIDPVEDLGVDLASGDTLPGEAASINFQYQCTFNNLNYVQGQAQTAGPNQAAVALELLTIVSYTGICSITPDNCVYNTGELTESEVAALLRSADSEGKVISSEMVQPTVPQGGSLFSKVKSIAGHIAQGASSLASIPGVKDLAEDLGKKALKAVTGGVITGAGVHRRHRRH